MDAAKVALGIERQAMALQRKFTTLASTDWLTADLQLLVAVVGKLLNQRVGSRDQRHMMYWKACVHRCADPGAAQWNNHWPLMAQTPYNPEVPRSRQLKRER